MKRLISAFLSIVMVASVFFCVDLSAYAAGDNDNYTMYQADYYSKNFSFDTPSFSQIYYDELSNDDLFITAVNAWETIHIATSPSYSLESGMITKKDYYKTVIFDLFAQSDSNDGLDNLLDIATNKQLSYAVNVSKAIMEAEDVTAETLNKVTPEKAINLIFGSKYCNIANGASVATKIAEWCQDAKEAVDTFSKYQAIYDLKNGTREFLNYIASDSSNPYELREAASECANYFENGYNEVLNQIIGGVQSIGDFTMKIITDTALDWAWTLIVSSIPGGKAVMIAAKGARALSNYLFSTDKEVEAYYKLEAQVAMENAIKSSVNQIKSSSNITSNLSDAAIYMNAVDGFRKAIILGFDYSIDLFEICANSKFNASTDSLFSSYTQCMNLVNQITNFKTEKENYFKIFENQCLNGYKNKYFPDYDSVLNGVEYQKIPVESISLSLIKDFSAGISGYINDYIKTEYSPSGYTEITMPNWESSNEGIIKFIPDYNGFCGGSFEAVSNGDCTITCSLSSGVSQSITVHVGEKQKEEEHDYYSDFEYRINSDGNTATITDYVGSSTNVLIPAVIDGYAITSIGDYAFQYCYSLIEITIPNSVTSIGYRAFYNCTSLTDVTIGNSVTSIGGWAFSDCTSLISIAIPNSVTDIGRSAFEGCTSLKSVTIPDSVTSIKDYTFGDCINLTDVKIGNSVTSIGECAFQNCQSLANVTIPNSVTSIGDSAFAGCDNIENVYYNGSATQWVNISFSDASSHPNSYADNFYITGSLELEEGLEEIPDCIFAHCKSLENITIPNSVTSIGSGAFYLCNNLKELTIPESVISIGTDAFLGCYNLENVYYNGSATQWINISFGNDVSHPNYYAYNFYITGSLELEEELEEIPDYTFKHCESLENVTIPNSVTSIGESAFYYCKSLTSVTIPDSVTSIGNNAFSGCTSLTSVTIPDSVTSMGNNAFSGCTSLTSITIPDSVTSIGESAFSGCTSLTSVTIPNSVTSIEDNAFDGCTSLTSITIPDSVTSIGNNAFSGCTSLTSVTIPDSVTSIGVEAFYKCTSLTDVTIGNGVTSIEYGTFSGCTSLTSIIIPDSVTSIDYYAFSDCTSLTDVTIGNGVTSIGYDAFSDCISLTEITIPNSVTSIDSCAFYHCRFLKELTIPESVTSIGTDAFLGCYSLENVYYPGSKKDWENISIGSGNSSLTNATIHFAKELSENIEDIETGIVVSENTGEALPENTELIVKEISPSGNGIKYDISLQKDGEEIQPNGNVTVKIPVPKNMDGFACKVYRQEADNTYTNMNATYQDGYMVFVTDHFSVYILTTGNPGVIAVVLGDVNGDYIVDAADAVMVQRYDAGLITLQDAQLIAADVTGDGTVDAADAVKIQRYDAGLISSV